MHEHVHNCMQASNKQRQVDDRGWNQACSGNKSWSNSCKNKVVYWLLACTHAGAERIDYWHEKRSGFLYYYPQLLATISVTLIHSKSLSTASGVHRCTQPDLLTWRTVMSKWKRSVPRWYVFLYATIDIVSFIRQVEGYCQHQFSSLVSSLVPVILIANCRSFVVLVRCLSIRKQQGDFVTSLVAATM